MGEKTPGTRALTLEEVVKDTVEHAVNMAGRVAQTETALARLSQEMDCKAEQGAITSVVCKKADVSQARLRSRDALLASMAQRAG
jgi:hypothetical protein